MVHYFPSFYNKFKDNVNNTDPD
ncbi:hypothetical protein NSMM_230035 [Nitrosomonas mobilis]|uniref:Uncharacterized protein n=1 Tax=Nitrosomonas mobilis TaxID=51642 RepID=A0A1G5SBM6_9PROT|nr:hypothetical protein NSMM_230035 [Nitrosomonas mobilis]